ncbi:MAG: S8 family serine peptidase [Bdellovibrionales bacterium]|nr:S8 family serine peptidase [Bdellovibrionales bacterium]
MLKLLLLFSFFIGPAAGAEVRLLVKSNSPLVGGAILRGLPGWQLLRTSRAGKRNLIRELHMNKSVEWVEEDLRITLDPLNVRLAPDPKESEQWSLSKLEVAKARSLIRHISVPVRVAVIDTGIDSSHPDLADRIFVNAREIPFNGIDDDENGFVDDVHGWNFEALNNDVSDDFNHGTHVAGIIGASVGNGIGVSGVSPNVEILPVRWTRKGSGWGADAIAAIHYAVKMGARIINASWGGIGYSKALEEAVRAAEDRGVLFVASAGNGRSNNDVKPRHPANLRFSNVISVASTDENDQLDTYSNFGSNQVEFGAPGKEVLSTLMGGRYGKLSGTSMAAAIVSGVGSLLLLINPELKAKELKRILMGTAVVVPGLEGKTITGGRIDAHRAARSALESIEKNLPETDDSDLSGAGRADRENTGAGNLIRPDASESGALSQGLEVRFVRRLRGVETPIEGFAFRAQTALDGLSKTYRSDQDGMIRDPDCQKSSISVSVTLEAPKFLVTPGTAPYEVLLNLKCGVAQTVIFEEDSESGQAIAIWQMLVRAERKLSESVGTAFWRRQIEMIWPGKGDYYSGDVVNLTQGHHWDVVAHELGHAVYDQAGIGAFGGGPHYIDQCYTGALALSEGWASFFSAWLNIDLADPDAKFEYMVKRRAPIRFENIPADVCGKSTNEWRVTGFFWDLMDTHRDGETLNEPFSRLWKDLARSRSGSTALARDRLKNNGWDLDRLREIWNLNFPDEQLP